MSPSEEFLTILFPGTVYMLQCGRQDDWLESSHSYGDPLLSFPNMSCFMINLNSLCFLAVSKILSCFKKLWRHKSTFHWLLTLKKGIRCGTLQCDLVAMEVFGRRLDLFILQAFSSFNDSMIPWNCTVCCCGLSGWDECPTIWGRETKYM